MRNLGALLALLAAGCVPGATWENFVEESDAVRDNPHVSKKEQILPLLLPPPPPELLLRKPADFRIRDVNVGKEFFLFFYEDEALKEEVVAVINHALPEAQRTLRVATPEEHDYAIGLFLDHWRSQGDEEKFRYFKEAHEREIRRSATLIDQQIRLKEAEVQTLRGEKYELEADLKSRRDTGTFADGEEKFFKLIPTPTLQHEIRMRERAALHAELQLWLLEYKRGLRDVEYARRAALEYVESRMDVSDLLPFYSAPQRIVDDVRTHVAPPAWNRSQAYIEIVETILVVHQTRDLIFQVRDYLDKQRSEIVKRQKQALPGQPIAPLGESPK